MRTGSFVVIRVVLVVTMLVGRYVLRMHAGVLLGVCAGAATSAPGLAAVQEMARSKIPTLGYGVTYANYVGKPLAFVLATPEQPDDHDNPLRVAVGNEASDRDIAEFSRRFDCTVWDGFGSTEGAIIITVGW